MAALAKVKEKKQRKTETHNFAVIFFITVVSADAETKKIENKGSKNSVLGLLFYAFSIHYYFITTLKVTKIL